MTLQKQRVDSTRRIIAAGALVLTCFALVAARLTYVQYFRHTHYATEARDNSISLLPIPPRRGSIYDRNGVLLAKDRPVLNLAIQRNKLNAPLPEVLDRLAQVVPISHVNRVHFRQQIAQGAKRYEPVPIRSKLGESSVARFAAVSYRFPGVTLRPNYVRFYPLGEAVASPVGYVSRLSVTDQAHIDANGDQNEAADHYDPRLAADNYAGTSQIGKSGVEQSYELQLHGLTGAKEVEVTAGGHPVRTMSRTPPIAGEDLYLTIDSKLQQTALEAFAGRRGALVALDPETGEVLALVSSPSYDPNTFVGGIDQTEWDAFNLEPQRPLFNRAIQGTYPIGSTYKPFMAMAALQSGARTAGWSFKDPGFFKLGRHIFHDDKPGGHGVVDMYRSLVVSCDTYYYRLANKMGVGAIHRFMSPFGFGKPTGIDIEGEAAGLLPSRAWKRAAFGTGPRGKWYDGDTVSLGIGQGLNHFTMLQLAHALSTLLEGGISHRPFLLKRMQNASTGFPNEASPHPNPAVVSMRLDPANVAFIKRAMSGVARDREGTAFTVFKAVPYPVGAKTGTSQVYSITKGRRYDAKTLAELKRDNSVFVAFSPVDDPKIVVATIVENGGWGSGPAAQITRAVLDYEMAGHAGLTNTGAAGISEREQPPKAETGT
jgi:penicillin-binding protein 2